MAYLKISRALPTHFKYNTDTGAVNEGDNIYFNRLLADFAAGAKEAQVEYDFKSPQIWRDTDITTLQIETDSTKTFMAVVYNGASPVYQVDFVTTTGNFQEADVDWSDAAFAENVCYTIKIVSYTPATLGANVFTPADNGTCQADINGLFTGSNNSIVQSATPCPTSFGAKVTNNVTGFDRDLLMISDPITLSSGTMYQVACNVAVPSTSGIINTPQPNIGFDMIDSHPAQNLNVFSDGLQTNSTVWNESHLYDTCHTIYCDLLTGSDVYGGVQLLCDRPTGIVLNGHMFLDAITVKAYSDFVVEATSEPQMIATTDDDIKVSFDGTGLMYNILHDGGGLPDLFFRIPRSRYQFYKEEPDVTSEDFQLSDGDRNVNFALVGTIRTLELFAVPWYIMWFLTYAATRPAFYIDGIRYTINGDMKFNPAEKLPVYGAEIKLNFVEDDLGVDNYNWTTCN